MKKKKYQASQGQNGYFAEFIYKQALSDAEYVLGMLQGFIESISSIEVVKLFTETI